MMDKEIKEAEYFHVDNGPVLPSLLALRAYLRMIPKSQYEHHVTEQKNDFADWAEHVFGEIELAKRLRLCVSREQMVWQLDDAFAEARMAKVMANQEILQKPIAAVQGAPEAADGVVLQEDAAFESQKKDIVGTNERVSAKYEDVARRMQEALLDPVPANVEKRIEQLHNRYVDIMARISEARRQGRDALIPALMMKQFNPKLAFAKVSREEKDFAFIDVLLNQADAELKEVMDEKVLDVKKEIMAMVEAQVNDAKKQA